MTAYETARAWMAFLIDHPDKSVSVAEYRGMVEQAQGACKVAHNVMMEAWK